MSSDRRAEPTARTKARRRAIDVLFEADQREQYTSRGLRALVVERMAVSAAQTSLPQYAADAVDGVAEHRWEIDETLASYIQGWELERLPSVDRAILRLAVWELVFNDELDAPVVIDEAVKLAVMLSGDDAPGFINAVLDRVRVVAPAIRADADARAEAKAQREAAQGEGEPRPAAVQEEELTAEPVADSAGEPTPEAEPGETNATDESLSS